MDTLEGDAFRAMVEELVPFNRFLGLKLERADRESGRLEVRLPLRPEFIGNPLREMPHGGVLSALIDATAGAAAALTLPDPGRADRLATIDMRVDYLRPARGAELVARAEVMRSGRRVIVVRVDVRDSGDALVALGSAAFNLAR